jgi:hypothetical protein
MKSLIFLFATGLTVFAQNNQTLTLPPSGNNQRNTTTVTIGLVKASIDYSSPSVHGPDGKDRRGHIWGELVPYGMVDLGFNFGKLSPWRAGANENTVFTVSEDVQVDGKKLPAGSYGVDMIPGKEEWTIVLSKESTAWGSFFYDPAMDFLRLTTKPQRHEYREWLTWEFPVRKMTEARIELQWEELAIGWDIKVPNGNELYMTKLRQELRGGAGFDWRAWDSAAQFTLQANSNLEEGLQWSDMAIGKPNTGLENFITLSTRYALLDRLKRTEEAKKALDKMVHAQGASPTEIHGFGRQMQVQGRNDIAIIAFKVNAERFPNAWPVNVGLGRAAALEGDNKKALEYFQKAAAQAPDDLNRKNLQAFIKTLSVGGSIAQ